MAILIHGDAAFPTGSRRRDAQSLGTAGYTPGHHSYHHQQPVGFTTLPSDLALPLCRRPGQGVEIPVVHVNADDPESCLGVMRMAIEYRDTFGKIS